MAPNSDVGVAGRGLPSPRGLKLERESDWDEGLASSVSTMNSTGSIISDGDESPLRTTLLSSNSSSSSFLTSQHVPSTQEPEKVKIIRDAIRNEDKRLRSRYFILSHEMQDTVGLLVYVGAFLMWYAFSRAWWVGQLPTAGLVVLNALAISLLHEMEHDLIHELYFKGAPWLQHVMFVGIWLIKSSAAPWWRKYYHLKHHMESGQVVDVEERLIGLGMSWFNWKRILVTLTPAGTLFVAPDIAKDDPDFSIAALVRANAPTVGVSTASLIFHVAAMMGLADWLQGVWPAAGALYLSLVPYMHVYNCTVNLPNTLRQACLVIISTYSHYYGDIPPKDVFFQTQILDHWLLWPLQLFCFNFGATHIIHHFVTRQPFYLRQLTAFRVVPVLKQQGCRHNDFGNQARANRWHYDEKGGKTKKKHQ